MATGWGTDVDWAPRWGEGVGKRGGGFLIIDPTCIGGFSSELLCCPSVLLNMDSERAGGSRTCGHYHTDHICAHALHPAFEEEEEKEEEACFKPNAGTHRGRQYTGTLVVVLSANDSLQRLRWNAGRDHSAPFRRAHRECCLQSPPIRRSRLHKPTAQAYGDPGSCKLSAVRC